MAWVNEKNLEGPAQRHEKSGSGGCARVMWLSPKGGQAGLGTLAWHLMGPTC